MVNKMEKNYYAGYFRFEKGKVYIDLIAYFTNIDEACAFVDELNESHEYKYVCAAFYDSWLKKEKDKGAIVSHLYK